MRLSQFGHPGRRIGSRQGSGRVSRAGMEHFPLVLPMDAVTSGEKQHGANRPPSAVQFCLFQELKRRGTTDWSIWYRQQQAVLWCFHSG